MEKITFDLYLDCRDQEDNFTKEVSRIFVYQDSKKIFDVTINNEALVLAYCPRSKILLDALFFDYLSKDDETHEIGEAKIRCDRASVTLETLADLVKMLHWSQTIHQRYNPEVTFEFCTEIADLKDLWRNTNILNNSQGLDDIRFIEILKREILAYAAK